MLQTVMKDARHSFAERLAQICEDRDLRPHGRQAGLVRILKERGIEVTQPAVKKWFDAEVLPDTEKCIELAQWAGVCFEWLMTGRGPKFIDDLYPSRAIAHVVQVMQAMEPDQQTKTSQVIDLLAEPPAADAGVEGNGTDPRASPRGPARRKR